MQRFSLLEEINAKTLPGAPAAGVSCGLRTSACHSATLGTSPGALLEVGAGSGDLTDVDVATVCQANTVYFSVGLTATLQSMEGSTIRVTLDGVKDFADNEADTVSFEFNVGYLKSDSSRMRLGLKYEDWATWPGDDNSTARTDFVAALAGDVEELVSSLSPLGTTAYAGASAAIDNLEVYGSAVDYTFAVDVTLTDSSGTSSPIAMADALVEFVNDGLEADDFSAVPGGCGSSDESYVCSSTLAYLVDKSYAVASSSSLISQGSRADKKHTAASTVPLDARHLQQIIMDAMSKVGAQQRVDHNRLIRHAAKQLGSNSLLSRRAQRRGGSRSIASANAEAGVSGRIVFGAFPQSVFVATRTSAGVASAAGENSGAPGMASPVRSPAARYFANQARYRYREYGPGAEEADASSGSEAREKKVMADGRRMFVKLSQTGFDGARGMVDFGDGDTEAGEGDDSDEGEDEDVDEDADEDEDEEEDRPREAMHRRPLLREDRRVKEERKDSWDDDCIGLACGGIGGVDDDE